MQRIWLKIINFIFKIIHFNFKIEDVAVMNPNLFLFFFSFRLHFFFRKKKISFANFEFLKVKIYWWID